MIGERCREGGRRSASRWRVAGIDSNAAHDSTYHQEAEVAIGHAVVRYQHQNNQRKPTYYTAGQLWSVVLEM